MKKIFWPPPLKKQFSSGVNSWVPIKKCMKQKKNIFFHGNLPRKLFVQGGRSKYFFQFMYGLWYSKWLHGSNWDNAKRNNSKYVDWVIKKKLLILAVWMVWINFDGSCSVSRPHQHIFPFFFLYCLSLISAVILNTINHT